MSHVNKRSHTEHPTGLGPAEWEKRYERARRSHEGGGTGTGATSGRFAFRGRRKMLAPLRLVHPEKRLLGRDADPRDSHAI
jgi:hypothetical protein